MKKKHVWPDNHWNWPISVNHKHGVRCGNMMWTGGQVNLSPSGVVLNPKNLSAQTAAVIENIKNVLKDLGSSLEDLVNLNCFYVNDGTTDEQDFVQHIADCLPANTRTAITTIPTPFLCYDGMLVEIECVAMRSADDSVLPRSIYYAEQTAFASEKFCDAVRCDTMIFVSAQMPLSENGDIANTDSIVAQSEQVAKNIHTALAHFGADFNDVVKTNRWYTGGDQIDEFEPAALSFADNFDEPGPAATGIPLPRLAHPDMKIKIAVIAMLGVNGEKLPRRHVWPESLWDWHVHLPYKHGVKCGNMIFLGGQVSLSKQGEAVFPGDLTRQTHQAMAHIGTILNELGANYDDVCKVMAVYEGNCGADALHSNLPIRSSYFSNPGPATTGVPLPVLAYESMCIEIDIYAMTNADSQCIQ